MSDTHYVAAPGNRTTSGHLRYPGFVKGLTETGLTLTAAEILMDQPGFHAGFHGRETMRARQPGLDAIYTHDDEMAIGYWRLAVWPV